MSIAVRSSTTAAINDRSQWRFTAINRSAVAIVVDSDGSDVSVDSDGSDVSGV
jgi:hypothetical protein